MVGVIIGDWLFFFVFLEFLSPSGEVLKNRLPKQGENTGCSRFLLGLLQDRSKYKLSSDL